MDGYPKDNSQIRSLPHFSAPIFLPNSCLPKTRRRQKNGGQKDEKVKKGAATPSAIRDYNDMKGTIWMGIQRIIHKPGPFPIFLPPYFCLIPALRIPISAHCFFNNFSSSSTRCCNISNSF